MDERETAAEELRRFVDGDPMKVMTPEWAMVPVALIEKTIALLKREPRLVTAEDFRRADAGNSGGENTMLEGTEVAHAARGLGGDRIRQVAGGRCHSPLLDGETQRTAETGGEVDITEQEKREKVIKGLGCALDEK